MSKAVNLDNVLSVKVVPDPLKVL